MKKIKIQLNKRWCYAYYIIISCIILFSIGEVYSRYKTNADISVEQAVPIYNIEADSLKTLEFQDRGWITYSFDVVNGVITSNNLWFTNQVEMTYLIKPVVKEGGSKLPLNIYGLYILDDNWQIDDTVPEGMPSNKYIMDPDNHPLYTYDSNDGFGPFILPYDTGNNLGTRVHYMLVYKWGNCATGDTLCNDNNNVNYAGKKYDFDIKITAFQKTS